MEFVPIVIALGVIAKLLQHAREEADSVAWRAAAKDLGLTFSPGTIFGNRRRISGTLNGVVVVVDATSSGSPNSTSVTTRFEATLPHPLGLGLDLRPEGMLSTLSKLFGTQDILVGDPGFDASVMVQASDARRVSAWLTQGRRQAIAGFLQTHSGARVSDAGVFVAVNDV